MYSSGPALRSLNAAVTPVVSELNWSAGKATLWAAFKSKVSKVEKMHIVVIFDIVLFFFL